MLVLTRADIEPLLSMPEVIDAVERAHADLTLGLASQPDRVPASVPGSDAILVPMTAVIGPAGIAGVKLLADIPANLAGPRQQSTIVVLDPRTGACEAFLHGEAVTRYRTAATSAVATRYLSRAGSRTLGLIGAGAQARAHLSAIRHVRPIDRVVVWSRNPVTAQRFAEQVHQPGLHIDVVDHPRDAVEAADILCTLTPAGEPIVRGAWFRAGLHVNAVGAPPRPDHREIDTDAVRRARLVVDTIHTAIHESGAIAIPLAVGELTRDDVAVELGDVITGAAPGRTDDQQITLFNSVGLPIQDFATARLVIDAARRRGVGIHIDLSAPARIEVPELIN
jgi:ornithine cyclodeaminase/alanine dehydrogenase